MKEKKTNQQGKIPQKQTEVQRADTNSRIVNNWKQGHVPIKVAIDNK